MLFKVATRAQDRLEYPRRHRISSYRVLLRGISVYVEYNRWIMYYRRIQTKARLGDKVGLPVLNPSGVEFLLRRSQRKAGADLQPTKAYERVLTRTIVTAKHKTRDWVASRDGSYDTDN